MTFLELRKIYIMKEIAEKAGININTLYDQHNRNGFSANTLVKLKNAFPTLDKADLLSYTRAARRM